MEKMIEYIMQRYDPLSIIVYGSYANGTNNQGSDFDALVISRSHECFHDTDFVGEVQLDVFVYPAAYFEKEYDCSDFIQLFDGKIVADSEGVGKVLQNRVLSHLQNRPCKTDQEIRSSIAWCVKMLERTKRNDAEGLFRWHWVLVDSLEIFCDAVRHPYLGPKKSLNWMRQTHPTAFACYEKALKEFSEESLFAWVSYLKNMVEATDSV